MNALTGIYIEPLVCMRPTICLMILKFIILFIFTTAVPHFARAGVSERYPFRIPSASELVHEDDEYEKEIYAREKLLFRSSADELRADGSSRCPLFSKLVFKITDRIVESNDLRKYVDPDSPLFKTQVGCVNVTKGEGGPNSGYTGVFLPASLSIAIDNEDEIAFVIAHEMAHIILRHYRVGPEYRKFKLTSEIWSTQLGEGSQAEKEADGLGAILVANSGYDPRAANESLCHTIRFIKDYPSYSPCLVIDLKPDASHGSNHERFSRIESVLEKIGYGKSPGRTRSSELIDARKESEARAKTFSNKN